jgi:hypothetical protein
LPYVWFAQLLPERWHLAFDSGGNNLMNPGVASVQIMQIGSLVAARIVSVAMRAIHQKQMPALRCIDRKLWRLHRSLSTCRKRRYRNRRLFVSHDRRNSERADQRRTGGADRREKGFTFAPVLHWFALISMAQQHFAAEKPGCAH